MPTTTIRVTAKTQEIARKSVAAYGRPRRLEQGNEACSKLRADPSAWANQTEEQGAWETTLGDGVTLA
jgi:hypothetical protein